MALIQFCAKNVRPSTPGVQQLPVSDDMGHVVVISKSENALSKTNPDCGMINLNLTVIEGPHANSSGVYRINLYHTDETTARIAAEKLSAVCHVTDVFHDDGVEWDTSALHNIPFRALVREQPNNDKYTEVYGVLDTDGNLPGQQQAATSAPASVSPPNNPNNTNSAHNQQPHEQQPVTNQQPWNKTHANVPLPDQQQSAGSGAGGTTPPWSK